MARTDGKLISVKSGWMARNFPEHKKMRPPAQPAGAFFKLLLQFLEA